MCITRKECLEPPYKETKYYIFSSETWSSKWISKSDKNYELIFVPTPFKDYRDPGIFMVFKHDKIKETQKIHVTDDELLEILNTDPIDFINFCKIEKKLEVL